MFSFVIFVEHKQKTQSKMKNYIATFENKKASFNANSVETMWFAAKTRKDAEQKARRVARDWDRKFVSIRMVK